MDLLKNIDLLLKLIKNFFKVFLHGENIDDVELEHAQEEDNIDEETINHIKEQKEDEEDKEYLPNGPSEAEIHITLQDIENQIIKPK